ncbi:MAG: hypothetical protein GWO16_01860 [Gammaproteobacteria bacterium]|nr:hypothetical protein [Gammaproteobacteria bacterium]NIR28461.1 hypothetical protein [Gammaproteobacteria bacterium]NIR96907.1 hypothetical protein [Gammaproteobacteria bacterium]NIT62608.1 hypothetical protein [Gammaproteobacteria bacterium]NIV19565.1 hypothetical protein [Gammaproteobacteria bacterium]
MTDSELFNHATRQKVAFLRRPDSYPEGPSRVEVKETHMSWVFLTDRRAYKLKKPVRYDFLDFSTIDARRRDCQEEVRLNRRLAPDVYLGSVRLTVEEDGRLGLDGAGTAIDWLVKMVRLPQGRMLDELVQARRVEDADLHALVRRLVRFYEQAPREVLSPDAYRARLGRDVTAIHSELIDTAYDLPAELAARLRDAQLECLRRDAPLFDARVEQGRIVEGHGDLRPEHVCLTAEPVIIDCLEFNREFRILDTADELAFLAVECERLGDPGTGERLLALYRELGGDHPPDPLMHFYSSYRAALRAKLAIWHTRDHEVPDHPKWRAKALAYLELAERHVRLIQR